MREIKFRAWDNQEEKYYEPVYAAYKGDLHELMVDFSGRLSAHTLNAENGSCMVDESLFPDRYILEQFTGLHDKNGKEIYEGDVLKGGWYQEYEVKWDPVQAEWNISSYYVDKFEIISNIHEAQDD